MTTSAAAIEAATGLDLRRPAARRDPARPMGWWLGVVIGRVLLVGGLLLLAFAAYQLWGTGRFEARAQEDLAARLAERLGSPAADRTPAGEPTDGGTGVGLDDDAGGRMTMLDGEPGLGPAEPADAAIVGADSIPRPVLADAASPPGTGQPATARAVGFVAPAPGEPFAALRIPAIGVDKTVVEGTSRDDLRAGPGHYRGTAVPGQAGNVAIAGHRTTYGAPFRDLDRLLPGDEIVLETPDGVFTYLVEDQAVDDEQPIGHRIVSPDRVEVIADRGDHRVTLTACHPLYSARERIVVTAVLVDPPPSSVVPTAGPAELVAAPVAEAVTAAITVPAPPAAAGVPPFAERGGDLAGPVGATHPGGGVDGATARPSATDGAIVDDLGWQWEHLAPTAGWVGITAGIAAAAMGLGRLWRRRPSYVLATPSFTLALLTTFEHLDRLIPAA
ncbi:MAG: sortase [Actinomycetota bacterium]